MPFGLSTLISASPAPVVQMQSFIPEEQSKNAVDGRWAFGVKKLQINSEGEILVEKTDWEQFLDSLGQHADLVEYAFLIRRVWNEIKVSLHYEISEPLVAPSEDGISLSWSQDDFFSELELDKEGHIDWFFRNRKTKEYFGNDEETKILSIEWLGLMQQAFGA